MNSERDKTLAELHEATSRLIEELPLYDAQKLEDEAADVRDDIAASELLNSVTYGHVRIDTGLSMALNEYASACEELAKKLRELFPEPARDTQTDIAPVTEDSCPE